MIYGIGTDICDIRRMAATVARRGSSRFAEHARCARVEARGLRFLATRFSAKEAFSKAIGLGIRAPMTWKACQILNEASGKPVLRLSGELAAWFEARGLVGHVTVTDETDYAASFVVVETRASTS